MIKFKKLLSVLLAVMMVMSVMPTGLAFADDEVSLQSAVEIPAENIIFEEDFEDYTVGESILAKDGDEWDFYSMDKTNVADTAKIVDASEISVDNKTGFSGKALMIHNEEATAYNTKGLMYRFGLENAIDLNSVENASKKLIVEGDFIVVPVAGNYAGGDFQSSFMVPTDKNANEWKSAYFSPNYSNGWKLLYRKDAFSIQTGDYAGNNVGVKLMGYNHAFSADKLKDTAATVKFSYDFSGEADSVSVWVNNKKVTDKLDRTPFTGHALNDMVMDEFLASNKEGQAHSFGAIAGFWGTASDIDLYIDNLKVYTVDQFELVNVTGNTASFDPATDALNFEFSNEIDAASIEDAVVELVEADGDVVADGITDVSANGKILSVKIAERVLGNTAYTIRVKGVEDVYGSKLKAGYEWYTYPINDYYTLNNNAGQYVVGSTAYDFTYVPGDGTPDSPAKITAGGKTGAIDCYIKDEAVVEGTLTTCTLLEYESATPANESITEYVQGEDQEIILTFNDLLADTVDIANAFEVKDEAGNAVTGLTATFGATKDIVVLQLKDLVLGEGKHTITSKEHTLFNANNKYANISYVFDTLDFTAKTYDDIESYLPTTEATINVELSLPTVLTAENIASGFEAVDGEGNPVAGLTVTLSEDSKVATLSLEDLAVEKGSVTLRSTAALKDARGRVADFELTFDIIEFNVTVSESSGFQVKPGENKTVTVELSIPTVLTAENIASGFEVVTQAGAKINGLGVALSGDAKTITLQLKDLVVDNGKYFIKSTDALVDEIGRKAEINLMFNVAKEVILFEEDFEFGYTLNENWINDNNKVSTGKYKVANGAWDIQSNNPTDSMSVVAVDELGLGAGFKGNALRLYNDAATSYSSGHFSFRRNFNGADGISLTNGEYKGKKLVYEADVYVKNVAGRYTADHQSSFFAPSRKKDTIHDYGDNQWKTTLQGGSSNAVRVEEGTYATTAYGPRCLWYNAAYGAHSYGTEAGTLKVILDQTGVVDTISVYTNGSLLTSTRPTALNGHKMSGLESSALLPAGYQGQAFNFADTIYGIWGSPSDMEIYVDNFKAYLIDAFTVESVEVDGSTSAFEASTDSIVYTFSGEVDAATVKDAIEVYDAEGNKLGTAIKSAVLENGNKVLRVNLAKSLAGETSYKVVLTDAIKDIYGSGIANDYVWYEYPINDYYTATATGTYMINNVECSYTPAADGTGAKMAPVSNDTRVAFVDCYVPETSAANREVEFTTSRKIVVENVSPAAIPGYDLGKDQTVTIKLAEALDASINLAEAFTVTDEDGKNIEGLQAAFGETTDTIVLQLSGLKLGNGKHFIESVDGALANEDGIFANVSISVSTVDFMVTYAEPGTEVLSEYKEGDDQLVVFGLSSSAAVASNDVADCFVVTDEEGNVIEGLQATYNTNKAERSDDDTISLQLKGLKLGKGKHTIKANANLVDRRGRTLVYEYVFTKLPFKAEYTGTVSGYEPKSDATIDITLTYELSDASIADINNAFIVENTENLRVSGLKATVSEDKKVIKLVLKDLDITGGSYKITSKAGALVSATDEALSPIMITLETENEAAFGPTTGEGAGSGAPIDPNADFSTVVLLDENFENSIEKAEKGIEFVPSVNWYTSPEKIPSIFKVEKVGTEYRDANISVVPDPADPTSGNMVLKYHTGVYAKDGSLLGTPNTTSTGKNYTVVSRGMDKTIDIPKDKYTEVRMSTKFYVDSASMANLPLSGQQLRNSQYIIAGTSNAGKTINSTNFAKDSSTGNPKFHMYVSNATATSKGLTGGVDSKFTSDEWHTMEYVFSVYEYVKDGNAMKGGFQVYVDGVAVGDGIAFLSEDYNTLNGMMARLVATDAGGAITVYYDDWKITKSTKYTTHVDVPATNVPENQAFTLTLTKKLDAASVQVIEQSLASDAIEDVVSVVDNNGNQVKANITITDGEVITITPVEGLKYATEYLVEVKNTVKVDNVIYMLKAEDGETYAGLSYPFETAKAKDTYIDAEASAASFNCFSPDMETATRFNYTMNLSGAHAKDVIAAVAVYTEKDELIGIDYQVIPAGATQANFDFNTFSGRTGAKVARMYIWEAKADGSKGRLMQVPDEITSR